MNVTSQRLCARAGPLCAPTWLRAIDDQERQAAPAPLLETAATGGERSA